MTQGKSVSKVGREGRGGEGRGGEGRGGERRSEDLILINLLYFLMKMHSYTANGTRL